MGSDQVDWLIRLKISAKEEQNSRLKGHFSGSKMRPLGEGSVMAWAHRHYLAGQIWHLTHRCHQRSFC